MKLMQSGIDFFGEGAAATYGCWCECIPSGYANADAKGVATESCGCWCQCSGEIRIENRLLAMNEAIDHS